MFFSEDEVLFKCKFNIYLFKVVMLINVLNYESNRIFKILYFFDEFKNMFS